MEGKYNICFDKQSLIKNAYGVYKVNDKVIRTIDVLPSRYEEENIKDKFGQGIRLKVYFDLDAGLSCIHHFSIYKELDYIITNLELVADREIGSNYMAPLVLDFDSIGNIDTSSFEDARMLFVPYDNDKWIRYRSDELTGELKSYEVTAIFDNLSRRGYVLGSISHDEWKTGISVYADGERVVNRLSLFSGVSDEVTRDVFEHGPVKGQKVQSSLMFFGYFNDFRRGLETYADANAIIEPKLEWDEGVPFGWNSWACVQSGINHEVYTKASQVLKEVFEPLGFTNNGTVYINFDACWQNLTQEELEDAVKTVHDRGQKAGIYFSPFAYWGGDINAAVEDTNGQYRYRDILAKDKNGRILPPLDGGYPIDPTHPVNLARVEKMMRFAIDSGFDYVKLDFMAHGAMECVHYNKDITTGIQAYNFGMKHILSFLDNKKIGRPFFINLSIAPIFPYHYAHARRVSCDAFGLIEDTEYMLNSLTYGFWLNDRLYKYNDPDHTVLYKSVNKRISDFNEGQSRLNASVISGTVMLLSDNYLDTNAIERSAKILNKDILEIAKKGKTFVPVEANTEERAGDMFTMEDGNKLYLAVFNYDRDQEAKKTISMTRLGLDENKEYQLVDIVTGDRIIGKGTVDIKLKGAQSRIMEINTL